MTEAEKTKRLIELAMIFYRKADAPHEHQWNTLITHLVERNVDALEEFCREFELDIGDDDHQSSSKYVASPFSFDRD